MPKRPFPFNGCSPLQLKTHVNAFHFEKANHMDSIYARTRELMHEGSLRLKKTQADQKGNLQVEETFKCQSCLQSKCGVRAVCIFCERNACDDCSRQCAHCAGIFCSLCFNC
ncbi:hypothetical protein OS493_032863 [Desmophyllum pertusum]|uniref:Apoptosis regulatory protein Siva n=1 Tax=Desmophyllum pertusum TaxID=174260 RepID=A0A9X0CK70_9CNID|nr:hypothetical protein OS493_032863 [Desmophyllum pertusum]